MVDTSASLDSIAGDRPLAASVKPLPQAFASYAEFVHGRRVAPPQSAAWAEAWTSPAGGDAILISVQMGSTPVLMLALTVRQRGPFRIAEFAGGSHANGNFPAFEPAAALSPVRLVEVISEAVRRARPDIDMLLLERQLDALEGIANPLADAAMSARSPNVALAASLHGGFDAVLERSSRKRKLKKYRSQQRKFEAAGGYRRIQAANEAEVGRLLDAFFAMRASRFRQQGIADVFAPSQVREALTRLYVDAAGSPAPAFVLHGLEVGGRLRAVTGSALAGNRFVCDFTAFADDDLAAAAPGDFLAFENIRAACEEGFSVFDFSVGDERYKRSWCDIETFHRDVYVPVSLRGRALAAGEIAVANAKRRIKENQTLWSIARRVRAMRGSAAEAAED